MPVTSSRTFIYGDFAQMGGALGAVPQPVLVGRPGVAIEILREFSPTELVGKVYVKSRGGNWAPVSQPGLKDYDWYREFTRNRSLGFWVDMVIPWEVLYFRMESDDAGPYVAVGLRQSSH